MFVITIRFIKTVYPVLKESLLGKQSLLDAVKTSKIKVLTLVYCLLSPFIISYLSNKIVSLASANVVLSKKVATLSVVKPPVIQVAAKCEASPPVVLSAAPTPPATAIVRPSHTKPSVKKIPIAPPIKKELPSEKYEELFIKNYEHY